MSVAAQSPAVGRVVRVVPRSAAVALAALRPRQWTKNLLLFAALLFASKLDDGPRWVAATAAFAAFCSLSSAAYIVNDLHDVAEDRAHPRKRLRPIASGRLTTARAVVLAVALAVLALSIGAALDPVSLAFLVAFGALQLAYTFGLKRLAFVDIAAIAGGFVLRAAAGAHAVHVHVSPWLLVCTALLALFLAMAKRRAELVRVDANGAVGRAALRGYSRTTLETMLWLAAGVTAASYVVYTLRARTSHELLVTVPFVLFGLGRYLYLIYRRDLGEEPEQTLSTDVALLACVALWAAAAAFLLTSS